MAQIIQDVSARGIIGAHYPLEVKRRIGKVRALWWCFSKSSLISRSGEASAG